MTLIAIRVLFCRPPSKIENRKSKIEKRRRTHAPGVPPTPLGSCAMTYHRRPWEGRCHGGRPGAAMGGLPCNTPNFRRTVWLARRKPTRATGAQRSLVHSRRLTWAGAGASVAHKLRCATCTCTTFQHRCFAHAQRLTATPAHVSLLECTRDLWAPVARVGLRRASHTVLLKLGVLHGNPPIAAPGRPPWQRPSHGRR
jgi:hypothetical protein